MASVTVVVGLGFGDEGKGTTVDRLTRARKAKLVVRYNGGAQAGHNVVTSDGRHHCFSQWGSGTFAGAPTLLSRYMMVNPIFALSEAKRLEGSGIMAPLLLLTVEGGALVTTQFHVAANRLRELARGRGGGVHGSCGMGIGETQQDAISGAADVIRAEELRDRTTLLRKLRRCQERKRAEVEALPFDRSAPAVQQELEVLTDWRDVALDDYQAFADGVKIVDDRWLHKELREPGHVLFEGAQGVLLDQDWGFHPHTTWSECTFANAHRLLAGSGAERRVERLGVLRVYHTRHGAGPFPTESAEFAPFSADDHNCHTPWQHGFRSGALDLVLARYALEVVGGCDGLVFTHLDKLDKVKDVAVCHAYDDTMVWPSVPSPPLMDRLGQRLPLGSSPPTIPDLQYQEELGRLLTKACPRYRRFKLNGAMRHAMHLGELLDTPVVMVSTGPTEKDKAFVGRDWVDGPRTNQAASF